jgi:chromosome segregation ATPase
LELTIEQHQINFTDLEQRHNDLSQQLISLQNHNEQLLEQIQQYDMTIIQKDELLKVQQDITQEIEQRYLQLEQKHNEQHALMIKLSTHLAAKESETIVSEATDSTVNETWNTILATSNYLRVENTRLTDDLERIKLENAHTNERNQTLKETDLNNQKIINELKLLNQSLQTSQDQFDNDLQQQIKDLEGKCHSYEQEIQNIQQDKIKQIEQFNQEKQLLNNQFKQSEDKVRSNEKQLTEKTAEIERQGREMTDLKGRITKLEADNQELKQMTTKLKAIAIKYRTTATAATATAAAINPTATTTTPASSTDADELLTTGPIEVPPAGETSSEANKVLFIRKYEFV